MQDVKQYLANIDTYGLEKTWENILSKKEIDIDSFGELYEIGLAHVNKNNKKKAGQYFTPKDVADVMAKWLINLPGENICDVCCGTGNLILAYLRNTDDAKKIISEGRVYLFDQDPLAMKICCASIGMIYGEDIAQNIHCISGDFLDTKIHLPENCKVISNPPYCQVKDIPDAWEKTETVKRSKELYAAIMEKIVKNSKASVIITPYSFIGGEKFYTLRRAMNSFNGYIVAFDNVPGNIFAGKKHGIFNTNTANSVRAAITVVENRKNVKGFKCSGLIRFKTDEREKILDNNILERYIGNKYQIVNDKSKKYCKCFPEFEEIYKKWKNSSIELSSVLSEEGKYKIYVPNTCRYYTVAAVKNLNRTGKICLEFDDEETEKLIYCMLNSSFCYWYWRLFDGGITYNATLLKSMPVIRFNMLSETDKNRLLEIAEEMQKNEEGYLVYKQNAGSLQENIKFPDKYRTEINDILLKTLGLNEKSDVFHKIHANAAFKKGGGENE